MPIFWKGLILAAICLMVLSAPPADAAAGNRAFIQELDSSRFPHIEFFLALQDPLAGRPAFLQPADVEIFEDDRKITEFQLTDIPVGLRWILVIDPAQDLLRTGEKGTVRLDHFRTLVSGWLARQPAGSLNDLTLIVPEGILIQHTASRDDFLAALNAYKPKVPAVRTIENLLLEAVGMAADPLPKTGMRRLVVVVSASEVRLRASSLAVSCPRMLELHTLFLTVWAGREDGSRVRDETALADLASSCDGIAGSLSNELGLISALDRLSTQTSQYQVEYRSSAAFAGDHSILARVTRNDFSADTPVVNFPAYVQPPLVEWNQLPEAIVRSGNDPLQPVEEYQPRETTFEVSISFPDGYLRTITAMDLFVDGEAVDGCDRSACPALRWDLRGYIETGSHRVQIVVRDEFGLEGKTLEADVLVTVLSPASVDVFLAQYSVPLAIGIITLVSVVIVLIAAAVLYSRTSRSPAEDSPASLLPFGSGSPARKWGGAFFTHRKEGTAVPPEPVVLVLDPWRREGAPLEISSQDILIGSDAGLAGIVLEDRSVSPVHARIALLPGGSIWVFGMGSTAGTWVNFEEVPAQGKALREQDVVHFGRSAFCVRLAGLAGPEELRNTYDEGNNA